jgi:hypothetical protein
MTPLGATGSFALFERPDKASPPWRSLKLIRTDKGPKKNWWLGWNGERLAVNNDQRKLAEHHPDIEAWVIETLRGFQDRSA